MSFLQSRVLKTEDIPWKSLQFIQDDDFKGWGDTDKARFRNSLVANQFSQPFYVWLDGNTLWCLDGRHRYLMLLELIADGVQVPETLPATFIYCMGKKEAANLVLQYSSIYAKVQDQGLVDFIKAFELDFEDIKLKIDLPEIDMISIEAMMRQEADTIQQQFDYTSLQERFVVPPFSLLDTRQGYWQERKRQWHKLGFDSQETREDVYLIAKSGQNPAVYELRNKMRETLGREPEWDEVLEHAKKKGLYLFEGASIFDPVLCEVMYRWFCPVGGIVLDPFAGGSVRGIVANVCGFDYVGIDLRQDQVDANMKQYQVIKNTNPNIRSSVWYCGDSNEVLGNIKEPYDFIFSCPPYHDLEKYSDDPADLSNMTYAQFVVVYQSIILQAVQKLKPNRFACFVVGDIRDEKGFYRNFLQDTIDAFQHSGDCKLYNEFILVNVVASLAMRVSRQFATGRKNGKMHQNVLVFYKGDPKKIREEFPEIKIEELFAEGLEETS